MENDIGGWDLRWYGLDPAADALDRTVPPEAQIAELLPVRQGVLAVLDLDDSLELWRHQPGAEAEPIETLPGDLCGQRYAETGIAFLGIRASHGSSTWWWASDGTAAGTFRLPVVAYPNPTDDRPLSLDTTIYIAGPHQGLRYLLEIDRYGSVTPVLRLCNTCTVDLGRLNGRLLFPFDSAIWSLVPGGEPQPLVIGDLTWPGGDLGSGQFHFMLDLDLWRSDGTPTGTQRALDVEASPASPLLPVLSLPTGDLFRGYLDDSWPPRLWRLDPDGTVDLVRQTQSPEIGSEPRYLTAASGERILFDPRFHALPGLYSSDGTASGTHPFALDCSTSTLEIREATSSFLLIACAVPSRLYRSDGTPAGTFTLPIGDFDDFGLLGTIPPLDAGLLLEIEFRTPQGRGEALWYTDGTPAGTFEVLADDGSDLQVLSSSGATAFFRRTRDDSTRELWRVDDAGTVVTRLETGELRIGQTREFRRVGEHVYFLATGEGAQTELARTSVLPTPAVEVFDDPTLPDFAIDRPLYATEDLLFLFGYGGSNPSARGLYSFDPLVEQSRHLADLRFPSHGVALHGGSLLVAGDWNAGHGQLLVTDGTAAGTRSISFPDGTPVRSVRELVADATGTSVFLSAHGSGYGWELFEYDAAAPSGGVVRLVHDLFPGAQSSLPSELTIAGRRLFFSADDGILGRELYTLDLDAPDGRCAESAEALCLQEDRFRVAVAFRDGEQVLGHGRTVPLSADTGAFWFFDDQNIETMIKVLDGTGLNDAFWVFYGALSDVEYQITVTDAGTGAAKRYFNPQGIFASVGDTEALSPEALSAFVEIPEDTWSPRITHGRTSASGTTCVPSGTTLCLNDGRFGVTARWEDFQGLTGDATARPLVDDSGVFWFFTEENLELVVKVLDARPINGHFWVYYGALSNVAFELEVTDHLTGNRRTYSNPLGRFASLGDATAFPEP